MNTLATKLLILVCLAMTAGLACADDRFDSRSGFAGVDHLEWRLGRYRGGIHGYEILYRLPRSRHWEAAPGAAVAVGDGWVLGTDRHRGGYGIYRWNGRGWSRMPGTAVRIGGSYQRPWVVNDRGIRYVWTGHGWRQEDAGRGGDHARYRPDDRWSDHDERRHRDSRYQQDRNDGAGNGKRR